MFIGDQHLFPVTCEYGNEHEHGLQHAVAVLKADEIVSIIIIIQEYYNY